MMLTAPPDSVTSDQLLDFRYFMRDKFALRLGLGFGTRNRIRETTSDTTGGLPLIEEKITRIGSSWSIGLGVEKHIITRSTNVDPYLSSMLWFAKSGGRKRVDYNKTTEKNGNYVEVNAETFNPKSLTFGFTFGAGFFWYFHKNMALGGELGLNFSLTHSNGKMTEHTVTNTFTSGSLTSADITIHSITKGGV